MAVRALRVRRRLVALIFAGLSVAEGARSEARATDAAASRPAGFRSLADIEAALDPLDVLANQDGIRRSIDLRIRFRLDSATLQPEAHRQLDVLGAAMGGPRLASYDFLLVGHTDASGEAEYNRALSERRAAAVAGYLVEAHGLDADRLRWEGRGERELLEGLAPRAAEHRRVEVIAIRRSTDAEGSPTGTERDRSGSLRIDW
jgi:outer membrane protein OmpA-like peptidoglycan-associated protein